MFIIFGVSIIVSFSLYFFVRVQNRLVVLDLTGSSPHVVANIWLFSLVIQVIILFMSEHLELSKAASCCFPYRFVYCDVSMKPVVGSVSFAFSFIWHQSKAVISSSFRKAISVSPSVLLTVPPVCCCSFRWAAVNAAAAPTPAAVGPLHVSSLRLFVIQTHKRTDWAAAAEKMSNTKSPLSPKINSKSQVYF